MIRNLTGFGRRGLHIVRVLFLKIGLWIVLFLEFDAWISILGVIQVRRVCHSWWREISPICVLRIMNWFECFVQSVTLICWSGYWLVCLAFCQPLASVIAWVFFQLFHCAVDFLEPVLSISLYYDNDFLLILLVSGVCTVLRKSLLSLIRMIKLLGTKLVVSRANIQSKCGWNSWRQTALAVIVWPMTWNSCPYSIPWALISLWPFGTEWWFREEERIKRGVKRRGEKKEEAAYRIIRLLVTHPTTILPI